MAAPILVTQCDDLAIVVPPLYENGVLAVLTGATIYAAIQDGCGRQIVVQTLQSSSAAGANWAVGQVVAEFARTLTSALRPIDAWLEIEATRSGKKTTFPLIPLTVQRGSIL